MYKTLNNLSLFIEKHKCHSVIPHRGTMVKIILLFIRLNTTAMNTLPLRKTFFVKYPTSPHPPLLSTYFPHIYKSTLFPNFSPILLLFSLSASPLISYSTIYIPHSILVFSPPILVFSSTLPPGLLI